MAHMGRAAAVLEASLKGCQEEGPAAGAAGVAVSLETSLSETEAPSSSAAVSSGGEESDKENVRPAGCDRPRKLPDAAAAPPQPLAPRRGRGGAARATLAAAWSRPVPVGAQPRANEAVAPACSRLAELRLQGNTVLSQMASGPQRGRAPHPATARLPTASAWRPPLGLGAGASAAGGGQERSPPPPPGLDLHSSAEGPAQASHVQPPPGLDLYSSSQGLAHAPCPPPPGLDLYSSSHGPAPASGHRHSSSHNPAPASGVPPPPGLDLYSSSAGPSHASGLPLAPGISADGRPGSLAPACPPPPVGPDARSSSNSLAAAWMPPPPGLGERGNCHGQAFGEADARPAKQEQLQTFSGYAQQAGLEPAKVPLPPQAELLLNCLEPGMPAKKRPVLLEADGLPTTCFDLTLPLKKRVPTFLAGLGLTGAL